MKVSIFFSIFFCYLCFLTNNTQKLARDRPKLISSRMLHVWMLCSLRRGWACRVTTRKKKHQSWSSKTRSQDKSPKYQTNTSLSPDSGLKVTYPEILEEDTSALNSCRVHENSCSWASGSRHPKRTKTCLYSEPLSSGPLQIHSSTLSHFLLSPPS